MAVADFNRQLRVTRSTVATVPRAAPPATPPISQQTIPPPAQIAPPKPKPTLRIFHLGSNLPAISPADLTLLRQKQAKLRRTTTDLHANADATAPVCTDLIRNALRSTVIFAQYEAGTAVCIDPEGWFLTCAHCFGDDDVEVRANIGKPGRRWVLTTTGTAVLVECRAADMRRDLALLKALAVEGVQAAKEELTPFPFVSMSTNTRMQRVWVACIGQPGADDLESATARKTLYNLFEISWGKLRGLVPNVDPHDNSEIGALKHDAWTYWGHSGAPLVREDDGLLVGLHSSWDDQTAMRHAVPLVAIQEFLEEQLPAAKKSADQIK